MCAILDKAAAICEILNFRMTDKLIDQSSLAGWRTPHP
jgi:hypothetical protein